MAQNRVVLPDTLATAVQLIEQRIGTLQVPATANGDGESSDQFGSGMVFGLREAEACILQAMVQASKGGTG